MSKNNITINMFRTVEGEVAYHASNGAHGYFKTPIAAIQACMPDEITPDDDYARGWLLSDYLDWRNNYLSLAVYAEHREITETTARAIIRAGEAVFND